MCGNITPEYQSNNIAESAAAVWNSRLQDLEKFDFLLEIAKFNCDSGVMIVESASEFDRRHYQHLMCEMLFERYANLPIVQFELAPVLSLLSQGRIEGGLVLDMGAGSCTASLVNEFGLVTHTMQNINIGGNALDASKVNLPFPHVLQQMKENQTKREKEHCLPDGTPVVDLLACEAQALMQIVDSTNKPLVCGGLSRTQALNTALQGDYVKYEHAQLSSWIGGSLLGALQDAKPAITMKTRITKADFQERGSAWWK